MDPFEIIFNCTLVGGFAYVFARIINYSQESADRQKELAKAKARKLHVAALSGDEKAAQQWIELKSR
jgi:hypothetical protein